MATPLQKWARSRYQLKGGVSMSVGLLKEHLEKLPSLTETEEHLLYRARVNLESILEFWDGGQADSRREVVVKSR